MVRCCCHDQWRQWHTACMCRPGGGLGAHTTVHFSPPLSFAVSGLSYDDRTPCRCSSSRALTSARAGAFVQQRLQTRRGINWIIKSKSQIDLSESTLARLASLHRRYSAPPVPPVSPATRHAMEGLHSTIDSEADLVAAVKQAQHAAERPSSWLAPPRRSSAPATGAASGEAAAAVKSHAVSGGDFDLIAAVMGSSAAAASVLESSAALYSQACSSASSSVPQQAPMKAMAQHEGSPAAPSLHRESAANRTEASRQAKADTVMLTKQERCQAAAAEMTSAGLGASLPLSPSPGAKPLFKQASAQLAASSRPRVAPTLQELAAGALPAEPSLVPASPLSVFTGAPAVPGPPSVPAPPAVAIPLASLAGLGDVMEGLR